MKSLIKKLFIASFFLLWIHSSYSQSITNSAYNVFGIGTLEQTGLVSFEAMGYAGLGARPIDVVNLKNPAALNSVVGFTQIFDVGITYSQLTQESNEASFSGSTGGLHDLNYWFRASPKTALSIGISKYSEASYDILDSQSGSNNVGRSNSRHLGEGGSSEFYLAGGHNLLKNLHLGVKTRFLFGSQQSNEILSITDPNTNLDIERKESFAKAFVEAGLQYEKRLGESSKIILGSTFKTGGNAKVSEEETIIGSTGTSTDTLFAEDNSEIYIPQKMGVGLGFQSKSWSFNLDYDFENWGSNPSQEGFEYRDRFITSFGAQYVKDRFSEKLIERISFRAGGGVHSNYISIDEEEYLSQYYTLGLGIPISRGAASLNLSYQLYSTGSSSSNLIKEYASTFGFSVSIRDLWFIKRAYD